MRGRLSHRVRGFCEQRSPAELNWLLPRCTMTVSFQGLVGEAVMLDVPARGAKRPWFRLQFSLASVFVVMTLCAVGTWYWYQRPFAVETKTGGFDPFASPGTPGVPWSRREVEYVRRVWG